MPREISGQFSYIDDRPTDDLAFLKILDGDISETVM